jgi:hypothetical protein
MFHYLRADFSSTTSAAWPVLYTRNFSFLMKASNAKTTTVMPSEMVIDAVVIPIGDKPRKSPATPTMLKLNATDSTAFSTKSSVPSWNKRLTRQYPGTIETNVNPNA